jgi:methylmalonyl-CoA mutase C-terminal domain/subunit
MDGHDRGARIVARALRDAGVEVIYTGRHVSIESIARTAVQEDVDVVGLSVLSGAHKPLAHALLQALDAEGILNEVDVVMGGTISSVRLRDELLDMGIADVFPGATPLNEVVRRVKELALDRRKRLEATQ